MILRKILYTVTLERFFPAWYETSFNLPKHFFSLVLKVTKTETQMGVTLTFQRIGCQMVCLPYRK